MKLLLSKSNLLNKKAVSITGSKSETNRLLILQYLYPNIKIINPSKSEDSVVLKKALYSSSNTIDIYHAGTAMRFLTALFSIIESKEIILTGSLRMQNRPIEVLVSSLKKIGANINYLEKNGYPPLKIIGKKLIKDKVSLDSNISSQYISALMLIAPKLKNGLLIKLNGTITSKPYILMSQSILKKIGIQADFNQNYIKVEPYRDVIKPTQIVVESDWSSASYYYSLVSLSSIGTEIILSNFKKNSLQGDSILSMIFLDFGVQTIYENNKIILTKVKMSKNQINYNLINSPDIAQTIAVTCLGLGINCFLTGLHTLLIKETNRLQALKTEIEKFGAKVYIDKDSINISKSQNLKDNVKIDTYEDHRMAMSFAPLSLVTNIQINNAEVVAKSYPDYWADLKKIGIKINKV
ncbi:MAG: 3-phosphoshikimate 1-carboxyvinyltransferase [Flavobacteriaceae bacterium]|nr:3-phosphoshikimate 1-carboxyvinyltransferase [Flavobacteriaceae bacterium]